MKLVKHRRILTFQRTHLLLFMLFGLHLLLVPISLVSSNAFNPDPTTLENILLYILNQERSKNGLNELQINPSLCNVAQRHSSKMAMEKTLSHDFPSYDHLGTRLAKSGLTFYKYAENVARCSNTTMRLVHEALMNSPGHRINILDPDVDKIGLGVVLVGNDLYITQVFCKCFYPSSISALEERLSWALQVKVSHENSCRGTCQDKHRVICRYIAQKSIQGDDPKILTQEYENDMITIMAFHDIDDHLISHLSFIITQFLTKKWSLGIAFGRSTAYPGGIYHVVMYCFNQY